MQGSMKSWLGVAVATFGLSGAVGADDASAPLSPRESVTVPTGHVYKSRTATPMAPVETLNNCPPGMTPTVPGVAPAMPGPIQPSTAPATAAEGADAAGSFDFLRSAGAGIDQGSLGSSGGGLSGSSTVTTAGISVPGNANFRVPSLVMTNQNPTPIILPGLFSATQAEAISPADRVSFGYGYFDGFRVIDSAGNTRSGFNLNQFNVGLEKTIFDGRASVYIRVPLLQATNNTSGQAIDGLGDLIAGVKVALLRNNDTGSMLTAGMSVAVPTGRDTIVTTNAATTNLNGMPNAVNPDPARNITANSILRSAQQTKLNPTFLQPWVGGVFVQERLFVQEYFGVIIPTDGRVSTLLNNNVGVGYQAYRGCGGDFLTAVTPVLGAQILIPVSHRGRSTTAITGGNNPPTAQDLRTTSVNDAINDPRLYNVPQLSVGTPDQVFLNPGLQVVLRQRAQLSTAVAIPVVGPRAYGTGFTVGLNYLY